MSKQELLYFLRKVREYLEFSDEVELRKYYVQDFLEKDKFSSLKFKAYYLVIDILRQKQKREKIMNQYAEYMEYYREVLRKTVTLSKEMDMDDSLSLSVLYTTLLWSGYFSYNGEHKYASIISKFLTPEFEGVDVLAGRGVCRNYSAMMSDLLREADIDSTPLANFVTLNKKSSIHLVNLFSGISKIIKTGNHSLNLIRGENGLYLFDPTLKSPANIINSEEGKSAMGNRAFYRLMPLQSYRVTLEDDRRELLERFMMEQEPLDTIDQEEWKLKYRLCMETIEKNVSLLGDYYRETSPLLNETVKGLHLVKK